MKRVADGRALARRWVEAGPARHPDFAGAYLAGSITTLSDDAELPPTSDVDLWIVTDGPTVPEKVGKIAHGGVILDVAPTTLDRLRSLEAVLGDYHVAPAFRANNIIADPTGALTALQAAVEKDFAQREWVLRRVGSARANILQHASTLSASRPFHAQVTSWLFATGCMTHMLLVAGLRNPTIRKRYVACRELLAEQGRLDVHERLLGMLGCREMTPERARRHLAEMTDAFDAAKGVIKTSTPFANDITDMARPIAVDGSRELVDAGLHREAVFWIAATYARCINVLEADAPDLAIRHDAGFRALAGELGVATFGEMVERVEQIEASLPWLESVADDIIAVTLDISPTDNR